MDFQNKVLRYLGKTAGRRWKDIISDIIAVIGGIKPSFLYDYSSCDSKSLDKLASEIELMCNCRTGIQKKAEHFTSAEFGSCMVEKQGNRENLHPRSTGVLTIQDDVFVINKQILKSKLAQLISNSRDHDGLARSEQLHDERLGVCAVIDVSGKLPSPAWVDRKITEQMVVIAEDILRQIEAGFADCDKKSCDLVLNLYLKDDWNVSTIFGLLLGYPVSYWYKIDLQDNCLAHTPLHVIKCKCDCVVKHVRMDSVDVGRSSTMFENKNHVIYSFSIPTSLLENASNHISDWKESIHHAVCLCEYFTFVSFDCSTVTLPVVAL